MMSVKTIEGLLDAKGLKIAIVAARFNDFIVDRLISGAVDYLVRHGASEDDLTLIRLPGAFELPLAAQKVARSDKYDGIVVLGAVIRGGTPHFDYVCSECAKGIAHASMESGLPMGFGLLTCDSLDQAIDRAGAKAGNKGVEAASAMLETIRVMEQL
ncbi:6,7-dimethyl-8-ribityllumazine synthase [Desulfovibrio sp. Huiquan2017]|uniref:6,7-dimethyl-8-ribityllumazine synthase n=1 Tax=Desulfovibrio sp. Huiquan2017 TaxID=2816861 RepID=UPI00336AE262